MRLEATRARPDAIPGAAAASRGVRGWVHLAAEERLTAGAIAGVLLAMLGVARWLEPDPSGVGTHTQLGLPPTFVMERFGTPCPLCGMTTAWAHTMEADLAAAFFVQPAGTLFAFAAMAAIPMALAMAVTGRRPALFTAPPVVRWGWRILLALLLAGWVYKLAVVRFGLFA